jgi:hypothetical protein
MIKIIPFKAEHMDELLKEEAVQYLIPYFDINIKKMMEKKEYINSIEMDGEVVFAGGVSMYWEGRGEAWAFFHSSCKKNFVPVFRTVRKWIDDCPVRRIEASVLVEDETAHRWIRLLGFQMEAPFMEAFRPDGRDCSLYSRVK